jgi:hypothetical protein
MIQKGKNIVSPHVLQFKIDHATIVTRREKSQEEYKGIAIAQDCPGTEPTCERKMLREEGAQCSRKLRREAGLHRRPPCSIGESHAAECVWNRSLAAGGCLRN